MSLSIVVPMNDYVVVSFYKFFDFQDHRDVQMPLLKFAEQQAIKGTVLLAPEGINATLAGTPQAIEAIIDFLRGDRRLADLSYKSAPSDHVPFKRLKIKLKREIVTFGQPQAKPNEQVGTYIAPSQWNQLICDPAVTLIDTRNDYEVEMGTFVGATNPQTASFREFPDYVTANLDPHTHPKVAMFCTGGIRCEKATSFLLSQGFQEVYHLQGGILKYLEEIPAAESLWQGECFVFDERVAVKQSLEPGSYDLCYGCGHPINDQDKASPDYEESICCPYCVEALTSERRSRLVEKMRQRQYSKQQ